MLRGTASLYHASSRIHLHLLAPRLHANLRIHNDTRFTGIESSQKKGKFPICIPANFAPLTITAALQAKKHEIPSSGPAVAALVRATNILPHQAVAISLEKATSILPHQAILENFIHSNPLHNLESMGFKEALSHVDHLESYMSPGERAFFLTDVDPRKRVNEALVDLCSAFLDRGAAKWAPNFRDRGFLYFFARLEGLGSVPWRKEANNLALRVLSDFQKNNPDDSEAIAGTVVLENLEFFGIPPEEHTPAIRSMLSELRGWAGMFYRMESHPAEAPANTKVRLMDFCAVKAILARSSSVSLAREFKWDPFESKFSTWLSRAPTIREPDEDTALPHISAIAYVDQSFERHEHLEADFQHALLNEIGTQPRLISHRSRPRLQVFACIDDREGSFRRHIEESMPEEIETFGIAGFFGIPILYRPADGREEMLLAPEGHAPIAILKEGVWKADSSKKDIHNSRRKVLAQVNQKWEEASFSPLWSLFLAGLFPVSMAKLFLMGYFPLLEHKAEERFMHTFLPKPRTDFELPIPPDQAAVLLARTFRDIGMTRGFAPVVVVIGHGASSANNPFRAAYNCGACCGRDGGPNARLLARLVNDSDVRKHLLDDEGIKIPDDTIFVGGMHNTTADTFEFFDVQMLPESHRDRIAHANQTIQEACGKHALERCQRFLLAKNIRTPADALQHVRRRSIDPAEVRPELNHSTNAGVVIGRRDLTKGHFLDRRVFLPSYDPYSDDDAGTNLEHVLAPALAVCSGINLEYLFSTVNAEHHGAGSKAPLNVVGNIGVLQGTAGDLRPGLPSQMTEMHTPIRALFIVDAPIERVEAVLARREQLRNLVRNEWVRLFVRVPATGRFYRQSHGEYFPVDKRALSKPFVPFTEHRLHGISIARRESFIYWTSASAMLLSCAVPIYLFGAASMNPYGPIIAVCGTMLSLPVLSFSRRYLHGEFMFGRFSHLCVGLLLGFNLVATAPDLMLAMGGWSLFGFASTFLIGAYNDRATVRKNAVFAFAAYSISDLSLLVAATFSTHYGPLGVVNPELVAGGLLLAAMLKSSQWPLTSLFVKSMEGPTPASALGYAGLSAHVGTVLLAGTMPMWFGFDWARVAVGSVGLVTAVHSTLVANSRSDRKGSIANATSATVGLIFVTLALGYPEVALLMSFGHAAFRMRQILLAPNVITDSELLRSGLGFMPWPKVVPDWLYRLTWSLRRSDLDNTQALHYLRQMSMPLYLSKRISRSWKLSKLQQWSITGVCVVLAGFPFTPLTHHFEEMLMKLLPTHPFFAGLIMAGHFVVTVALIRFLLFNVLSARRFHGRHR